MNIVLRPNSSLKPASWRANYVLKPDLALLRTSMIDAGWLGPIVVRAEDSSIIDGFHRWLVAQDPKFVKKYGSEVPCVFVDVDEIDAMVLHVRMNRARGQIVAKLFSNLIRSINRSGKYDLGELSLALMMTHEELQLMLDGSLIKKRNIKEHVYSKAWIPVEAPPADQIVAPTIERPLHPDR